MLYDRVHGCLQSSERTTIRHVALEVGGVGVLLDGHAVAGLHHLDSSDRVARQGRDNGRHCRVDVVQEGALVGKQTGKHWHDSALQVINNLGWQYAQELLKDVIERSL